MDKVNDSVRLVEERVARLVEDRVTEIQAPAQNSIQNVNTEITSNTFLLFQLMHTTIKSQEC